MSATIAIATGDLGAGLAMMEQRGDEDMRYHQRINKDDIRVIGKNTTIRQPRR